MLGVCNEFVQATENIQSSSESVTDGLDHGFRQPESHTDVYKPYARAPDGRDTLLTRLPIPINQLIEAAEDHTRASSATLASSWHTQTILV
jgi:hypothetical protein